MSLHAINSTFVNSLFLIVNTTHVLIGKKGELSSSLNIDSQNFVFPPNSKDIIKNQSNNLSLYEKTLNCSCGRTHRRIKTIDENQVWLGDFPWLVGFVPIPKDEHRHPDKIPIPFCYGSLINSRYIISAASCMRRANASSTEAVFFGSQRGKRRHALSEIIIHGDYNSTTETNDLALIKLQNSVLRDEDYATGIAPVCLPETTYKNNELLGQTTRVLIRQEYRTIFYGQLSYYFGVIEPRIMRTGKGSCQDIFVERIQSKSLCEHENAISYSNYCYADQGMPLMLYHNGNLKSAGKHSLLGVFSTGHGCKGWTGERPGDVSTGISGYLSWILENSSEGNYCIG